MRVRPGRSARSAYSPDRANSSTMPGPAKAGISLEPCQPSCHWKSPRSAAFRPIAVTIARMIAPTSRASSETKRAMRRSVSMRSRNDSAGGRLERMSRLSRTEAGTRMYGVGSVVCWSSVVVGGGGMVRWLLAHNGRDAQKCRRFRRLSGGAGAYQRLYAGLLDRPAQSFAQVDLRLPAQRFSREPDVGLADLRVVGGQRLENDLRARPRDLDDRLGQLEQGELVRVADVDGLVQPRLGEADHAPDQVVDVAEGPRLLALAEHRDRAVLQRLAQEGRDGPAVVRAHARPVGVEDADDRRVDALLAQVGHRHRLGVALGLVVDAARPDRVDVAPVGLLLRMDLGIAVDLRRRGQQEAGALGLREAECVVGAVGADLERVQRQARVVDRAGRRGHVVHEIDRLVDVVVRRDVRLDEAEVVAVLDVRDVVEIAGLEVVHADDAVALRDQVIAEVRAQEAGSAGYETSRHVIEGRPGCLPRVARVIWFLRHGEAEDGEPDFD